MGECDKSTYERVKLSHHLSLNPVYLSCVMHLMALKLKYIELVSASNNESAFGSITGDVFFCSWPSPIKYIMKFIV